MRSRTSRRSRAILAALVPPALAAASVAGTTVLPAQAATPSYTITTGATGTYGYADDTPAYPYIDSDGTFYFQSSHSLYGATQGRAWNFWSGTNLDTGVSKAAISSATDNADTTARCNNSPTGLTSTYAPAGSSFAERNYCDLIGVWVDPDTGTWYGIVHNEFTPQPFGDGVHFDAIDYAQSTDKGNTWTIKDHILTSPFSTTRGDTNTTNGFPNETYYFGDGDPKMFVDYASGYIYVFYESQILNKAGGNRADFGHVARSPISAKFAPSSWEKYYNGAWSQPGVGGKEADLVPADSTDPAGYLDDAYNPNTTGTVQQQLAATPPTLPTVPPLAWMNVVWDAYLGEYIAMPRPENPTTSMPLTVYATTDLATEKWTAIGTTTSPAGSGWYRSMWDSVSLTSNQIVGKTFRDYCMYNCGVTSSGSTIGTEWVSTTIDSTSLPTPPVAAGTLHQIAAGDGQYLAQSGTGLTTVSSSSTAASQGWKFISTGDGFFTIANASSGQNLGVDDTGNAGRRWGAPLALGTGSSVGYQWGIQAVHDADLAGGSYRLVNRYSGQALSLTSGTGGAATAPQRDWTNTGTSGDTHAVNAQTLTFPASGTNLLPGGNFESGNPSGWTVHNAAIVTDSAAHSPTHDLQLKSPAGDYATTEYTVTGLAPNTAYTYSGWVRADTGNSTSFGVKNYGGTQVTVHTTATGWTPVSDQFTTGATNTSATVFCYLSSASATSTCDDLALTAN